jgi:hypothetical protein
METKYTHTENGQEVRQEDLNSVSTNAALADDRVLWELFRLKPYNVAGPQKVILPFGQDGWGANGLTSTALVHPSPIGGRARVRSFRAAVASTNSTDNLERIRGIRSGYFVPTSAGYTDVTINANASTDPRWTLVYAKLEPDKDGDNANVKKRDKTTGTVSTVAVVLNKKTVVSLGSVVGTAAASPVRPAIPADAAGAYYIPLAYVLVPGSFGVLTVLERERIYEVAPCVAVNSATGAVSVRPANKQWVEDGTVDTNQAGEAATPIYRPGAYLPPTMVGAEERIILIQNHLAPLSHADGSVADNSCDWRFRFFSWYAFAKTGNTTNEAFASDRQCTGFPVPSAMLGLNPYGTYMAVGMGQSFIDDTNATVMFTAVDGAGAACVVSGAIMTQLGGATNGFMLYVRNTDGALILKKSLSASNVQLMVWLRATAPYSNYGTV